MKSYFTHVYRVIFQIFRRLPGLESSKLNKEEEDHFYEEMMVSVLTMATTPLFHSAVAADRGSEIDGKDLSDEIGHWKKVNGGSRRANVNSSVTWKNLLKWKIFTTKSRSKVFVATTL